MRNGFLTLIILIFPAALGNLESSAGGKHDVPDLKLEWDVKKVSMYQFEPVMVTLNLWTPALEVSGVSESRASSLSKGEFSYVSHANLNRQGRVVEKDGRRWYVYPVDSYVFAIERSGKSSLQNGRYFVDVAIPVIYEDPFWGRMQTSEIQRFEVPVEPLEFEVRKLPENNNIAGFSGAIGNFEVNVDVPPGEIYLNEEATAVITVKGEGWLDKNILPEYLAAFGDGTKLKSFSESRDAYIENGKLVSVLQMECTFIPTSIDNSVIGSVVLEFFDPSVETFSKCESEPVKVDVQSIAGKSPLLDI